MKRFFTLVIILFVSFPTFAQTPQAFNYQGVARDNAGHALENKTISIKASILSGSASGEIDYSETHSVETNKQGLFSLAIGNGTPSTGTFSSIPWSEGPKFLKIEIDPEGGDNYSLSGTSQILSVPYALVSGNGSRWDAVGDNINFNKGNVGIGSSEIPSEKLSVSGKVESKTGGFKFPDGTIQSTAANFSDTSNINELQNLSLDQDTLKLTEGGSVVLTEIIGKAVKEIDSVKTENLIVGSTPLPSSLDNGLVLHLPFNNNANDESGNGKNGTVNGPVLTSDRFGNDNSAYYFDGDNDVVEAEIINVAQSFSVSLWFYAEPDALERDYSNLFVLSREPDGAVVPYTANLVIYGPAYLNLKGRVGTATYGETDNLYMETASLPQAEKWYHVCYTFDKAANKAQLFLNGKIETSKATMSSNLKSITKILIGRENDSDGTHFLGKLDDYRVYNRALSEGEVAELFTEEGSGILITDKSIQLPPLPPPSDPSRGEMYFDSNTNSLMIWNGNSWVSSTDSWSNTGNDIYFNRGNVGIGTDNPHSALEVNGNITLPKGKRIQLGSGYMESWSNSDNLALGAAEISFTTWENVIEYPGWITFGYKNRLEEISNSFQFNMRKSFLGIGNSDPKSSIHISSGDIYLEDATKGVIMKSPGGKCFRMTVSDAGTPVFSEISCP